MQVTFLGTGTSQGVPVIACNCNVCKSKDPRDKRFRTSVLIKEKDATILIDAGPDFRLQMLNSNVQNLDAILFTHEHKDHTAGLDDVRAFNFKSKQAMQVYASKRVQKALKLEYSYIFDANNNYPGIPQVNLNTIDGKNFFINEIEITPISVYHYKLPVFGFRIKDFTYITDANKIENKELEKVKGSKIIVLNALRKEPHISHFTLKEAIALLVTLKPEKAYLTHISHLMGKHEDVEKELPDFIELAYDGLNLNLQ